MANRTENKAGASGKARQDKIDSPISELKGIGPRRRALFEKLGVRSVRDLLFLLPRRYEDRRGKKNISALVPGSPAVVRASVRGAETKMLSGGRRITTCLLSDGTGELRAAWFNRRRLEKTLADGAALLLYGTPLLHGDVFEMTEPEFAICRGRDEQEESSFCGIIPVYPAVEGITQKTLRSAAKRAVEEYLPFMPEELPRSVARKNGLLSAADALREMHFPQSPESWKEARRRLAYEELFKLHLLLAERRRERECCRSFPLVKGARFDAFVSSLPFSLTSSQKKALDEIINDGASGAPISRLLQGDVGSGKTLVAAAFAACVCDGGAQCALMAPTETLVEQLHAQALKYLAPAGVVCAMLKSKMPARVRRETLAGALDGSIDVVTGTQALLSDELHFKNLGAVIIDEQQRFGVRQRACLLKDGGRPHLLMMSATPIPRTMAQTLCGDMDISVIDEKPAGRVPPATRVIDVAALPKLLRFIAEEIAHGGRVYWICPRVEEDEGSTLPAAGQRFEWLKKKLPPIKISLIHGRMGAEQKDAAIASFRDGKSQLLVGTTVLEVGVDVPEATVIVIESPERYGLSQLHQLRGRVGRGARRGVCVLIAGSGGETERLRAFAATDDGFAIARADLEQRGEGELAGLAQHGLANFKIADLRKDFSLAEEARKDAEEYLKNK
ncbi:MAG: ATP-dependent DNA helicase RecG [Synergistes jonesii]|uniref:ATP-dependent DNA helicase RecG n=1 Tax=Synergistes jonesii TaxID=2754 RepID=UPI002A759FA8|nr:ATP-dependent DNA helicase RecG [Synergistes jonesii]MDY2985287.1 ATP-dependent DNA helicase RecG [Synergistes jonesii]